jgi:Tol biopolymer transport system component
MIAAGLVALPIGAIIGTAPAANAAFTGTNGNIAFVSTRANGSTFGGIFQVNSQYSGSPGLGTTTGDQNATTGLTDGGGGSGNDTEPFYSPNGGTVFFSSSRDGSNWVIYDISTSSPEPPGSATELSQPAGSTTDNDYAPSVANDGRTVVFNRDDTSLDTLDALASTPSSTVCTLYTPSVGLQAINTSTFTTSRAVFNPVNPTELLYVGGDNHLHLVTGLPAPNSSSPTNPCGAVAGTNGVTDTDLSAAAIDSTTGSTDSGHYIDENADWSPNGSSIIFDSTRAGGSATGNDTLWQLTSSSSIAGGPWTVTPLWPSQVGTGSGKHPEVEPVYSPDGTQVAFVQNQSGQNTWTGSIVGSGGTLTSATNVSMSTQGAGIINDQPDWGPGGPSTQTPEAPVVLLLPGSALILGGLALVYERRRRSA